MMTSESRGKRIPRRFAAGFTLLEILIAIVILVVGITGIVALFPTAIKAGNQTVVDSYASIITQSVMDAITVGMREARYRFNDANDETWEYFVFDHDGISDNLEKNPQPEIYEKVHDLDFTVLLPRGPAGNKSIDNERTLHFPNSDKTNRRNPTIGSLVDDEAVEQLRNCANGIQDFFQVRRVFHLGRDNNSTEDVKPIRDEFLSEQFAPSGTGSSTGEGERAVLDPYPQYSYSFAITRAKTDTDAPFGILDGADEYSDNLFEVKIKIFRNFNDAGVQADKAGVVPKSNFWIHEFVTLIST